MFKPLTALKRVGRASGLQEFPHNTWPTQQEPGKRDFTDRDQRIRDDALMRDAKAIRPRRS
jgi:hypothetical protein